MTLDEYREELEKTLYDTYLAVKELTERGIGLAFVRESGLDDFACDVHIALAKNGALDAYDPKRGPRHAYLLACAQNAIFDMERRTPDGKERQRQYDAQRNATWKRKFYFHEREKKRPKRKRDRAEYMRKRRAAEKAKREAGENGGE